MARKIDIRVEVFDNASKKLAKVERKLKDTGRAAKTANKGFLEFNRTLFTTTAFIGTFVGAFSKVSQAIQEGAKFELLERQFERVFGKNGNLMKSIRGFTNTGVDEIQAMRSAVELGNLGVVKSTNEAANLLAKGAAAARRAGLDSSEGIKRVTQFMKDGNIAHLQAIGIVRQVNTQYLAQQGVLGKVKGGMAGVVKAQHRLSFGLGKLNKATKDQMFTELTLADINKRLSSSYNKMSGIIGKFLGRVFLPLIEKFTEITESAGKFFDKLTKNNKKLMDTIRVFTMVALGVTTLAAAFGTLRLSVIALGSLTAGIPGLTAMLAIAGAAFASVTSGADTLTEKFKTFGNFLKGIFQLITSFDSETGISKIDKDLKQFLESKGIMEFTRDVSRALLVTGHFIKDVGKTLMDWGKVAFSWLEKVSTSIRKLFNTDSKPWSMKLLKDMDGLRGMLVKLTAAFLGLKVLKGLFGGVLGKIPVIGRLFGGGGGFGSRGGTPSNPVYTKEVGLGGLGGFGSKYGTGMGRGMKGVFRLWRMQFKRLFISPIKRVLLGKLAGLSMMFDLIKKGTKGPLRLLFKGVASMGTTILGLGKVITSGLGALSRLLLMTPWGRILAGAMALGAYFKSDMFQSHLKWLDKKTGGMISGVDPKYADHKIPKKGSDEEIRGIYKHAQKMGWAKGKTFEEYKADYLKQQAQMEKARATSGKKSQVSVPYDYNKQLGIVDEIGEQISSIDDAEKRKQAQVQAEEMMKADSHGGRNVTEEELAALNQMISAWDSSKVAKNIEEMNNKITPGTSNLSKVRGK